MLQSTLGISTLSFFMVALLCPILIWGLRTLKLTQPIRAELPPDHQAKRGTPLMAGLVLLTGILVTTLTRPDPLTLFLNTTFILFSIIGFIDDFKKAYFQDPSGVSGKTKLVLQFTFTGVLLWYLISTYSLSPNITIFGDYSLKLPFLFYLIIMVLFIVGSANAINFTDGLDGLLISVAIPTYFFFFIISDKIGVQTFSLVMIGCLLGLFFYNIYPARAFMGDTGSLAIGGSLAFMAIIEKVEILIPILFFIYLSEQLSVILQVWYYKKTKLRIFRMAPIHYHFSLKYGWSENKIVMIFGFISWVSTLICLLLWKFMFLE
ncbi:phospho-N-acetylmuramoyl-pentapeptide-transferase [Paenibacillus sp. V4I3]|uniref:phospho-N-acetylmuramoyl-pentapeptide- transferase n=1 Tax=unclassified Paenibacillus TaxID=185978 RepID=UPI00277FD3AE|nr:MULTISPECIES: phospho-N-acetylmuramoyl-pentapeptide-transferase [unclassified Paenibacillus]MDQ0875890.1 phospho-N-acetylmuramoyl-pentapeptide-transferase [Paenibacillus sp. V4I3]MDQ0888047.1 phospho-N-acetylmuramoyl-pentapeptide-transferase [Paenibacillus sp. V4I9]MDQ0901020.1 phospho-N-acetylmuramoyl-pentapeptide-transferase [Paenibacillus sp. V4I7]MDQ0920479.1 phospho-N-acetylmuramoyl-pentapeptide-transferase [Paenibacillus sp. V4I5]